MPWLILILIGAAMLPSLGDNEIINAPSAADVKAGVPAKPPAYAGESAGKLGSTVDEWDQPNERNISPDGTHFIATAVEPDSVWIWRYASNQGIFLVGELSPDLDDHYSDDPRYSMISYVRYDLPRLCGPIVWSPDSQYVVMTTTDPGGHFPWHFEAFVYSVKSKTLRYMDPVIGDVISASFEFVGPHTVEMSVAPANRDFARPKKVDVDLDQKFAAMKKQKGRSTGSKEN
jgi:hypothetical protein